MNNIVKFFGMLILISATLSAAVPAVAAPQQQTVASVVAMPAPQTVVAAPVATPAQQQIMSAPTMAPAQPAADQMMAVPPQQLIGGKGSVTWGRPPAQPNQMSTPIRPGLRDRRDNNNQGNQQPGMGLLPSNQPMQTGQLSSQNTSQGRGQGLNNWRKIANKTNHPVIVSIKFDDGSEKKRVIHAGQGMWVHNRAKNVRFEHRNRHDHRRATRSEEKNLSALPAGTAIDIAPQANDAADKPATDPEVQQAPQHDIPTEATNNNNAAAAPDSEKNTAVPVEAIPTIPAITTIVQQPTPQATASIAIATTPIAAATPIQPLKATVAPQPAVSTPVVAK